MKGTLIKIHNSKCTYLLPNPKQNSLSFHLGLPDPLDAFSQANIVSLELIKPNAHNNSSKLEQPIKSLSDLWQLSARDVVTDDSLEANVRMDEDGGGEEGVCDWIQGAGSERCDCERDETDGDGTLKGPVVGTVRG